MKRILGFIIFFGAWEIVGLISEHGLFLCRLPFVLFAPLLLFGMLLLLISLCISWELMTKGRAFPEFPIDSEVKE